MHRPISCNCVASDLVCTSRIHFDNVTLCNVVVDSNLQDRVVFSKFFLEFLSLINFSNNFHNFIILLNLLKSN